MKVKNFSRASRGIISASTRLLEYAATATGPPQISWLRPWVCVLVIPLCVEIVIVPIVGIQV